MQHSLEARMRAIELKQQEMDSKKPDFDELIGLLKDVKSALRIFVKIGNAVKWIALVITAITGGFVAVRKWL